MTLAVNSVHVDIKSYLEEKKEESKIQGEHKETKEKIFYRASLNKKIYGLVEVQIFNFLDIKTLCTLASVSKKVKENVEVDRIWRPLYEKEFPSTDVCVFPTDFPTWTWNQRFIYRKVITYVEKKQIKKGKELFQGLSSDTKDRHRAGMMLILMGIEIWARVKTAQNSRDAIYFDPKYSNIDFVDRKHNCSTLVLDSFCQKIFDGLQTQKNSDLTDFDATHDSNKEASLRGVINYISAISLPLIWSISASYISGNLQQPIVLRIMSLFAGTLSITLGAIEMYEYPVTSICLILNGIPTLPLALDYRKVYRYPSILVNKVQSVCSKIGSCFSRCLRRR